LDIVLTTDSIVPPEQPPSPASPGLRARLKLETHALHRQAERSGIMHTLLRGRIDRAGYGALLRNLYEIYAGLEPALEAHAGHPLLAPIVFPSIFRREALAHDLAHLAGGDWERELGVAPAAAAYRERLEFLGREQPPLLAAHAYLRYLGDLSCGPILCQLVVDRLHLGDEGTRYYQFGTAAEVDLLVTRLRAGLDAIPADGAAEDAIVAEARRALGLYIDLFVELAG
jgi:heme oxygenase